MSLLPRIIRFRDAPFYLGMDRNRFNAEVRASLTELPIGTQGIGFDRLELDAWVEDYKCRNGRPGRSSWDENVYPASLREPGSGTSTSRSQAANLSSLNAPIACAIAMATCLS